MDLTLCVHNCWHGDIHKKADSLKIKVNDMKDRKFCADENKLRLEKEWRPYAQ